MTGDELKKIRMEQKISRRVLAERCGLHPDTIRYWENKGQFTYIGYALKLIIAALGLPPEPPVRRNRRPNFGYFCAPTRARNRHLQKPLQITYGYRCGAKTRKGTKCRAKPVPGNRRCKFHGGMSTGPKTAEGRARIAEAQRLRWQKWSGK